MAFWGFGMNFVLKMNLNIAIVSMVQPSSKSKNKLENEFYENHSHLNKSFVISNYIHEVSIRLKFF